MNWFEWCLVAFFALYAIVAVSKAGKNLGALPHEIAVARVIMALLFIAGILLGAGQ